MYQFTTGRANVHSLVLGNVPPVPAFRSEFYRISLGIFLEFVPVTPYSRFDSVAVFVSSRNGKNFHFVLEGNLGLLRSSRTVRRVFLDSSLDSSLQWLF